MLPILSILPVNNPKSFVMLLSVALLAAGCQPDAAMLPEEEAAGQQVLATEAEPRDNHSDNADSDDADSNHDHENHDEHDGHNHSAHEHHGHQDILMTTYQCQPQQTIEAHYIAVTENAAASVEANAANTASADNNYLLIDGIQYDLTPSAALPESTLSNSTNSMSYETEYGLSDDAGLIWQVNGTKATLYRKTLNRNIAIEKESVLFNCQQSMPAKP
jgi:hypothetical protein